MKRSAVFLTCANSGQRVMVVPENVSSAQVAEAMPGDPTVLTFANHHTLCVKETVMQFVQLCEAGKKSTPGVLLITDWNAQRSVAIIKESVCYIASDQKGADIRLLCGSLFCARETFVQIVKEW